MAGISNCGDRSSGTYTYKLYCCVGWIYQEKIHGWQGQINHIKNVHTLFH